MVNGTVPSPFPCRVNPANLVTVQDSGNHDPLDVSQVPNQGTMSSLQDSKCTELDSHVHQLSPMAKCGHTNAGLLVLAQP